MKCILAVLFIIVFIKGFSQVVELRAGKSAIPGDYVALRYQQPSNLPIDFSFRAFLERSRINGLDYSAFGFDVLAEYPFQFMRIGIGPTFQIENEPWAYRNFSFTQRLNYGLCAEAAGELFLNPAFSLTGFVNQKLLFNKTLGQTHFVFGIGIKYSFGN